MAMPLRELQHDVREPATLRSQLRTLRAVISLYAAPRAEGPEVRTCTHCGAHVPFRIDPLDSWAECPICHRLA
ncbi:MAG TPA: hypothetical protein VGR41_07755 [Actinomycetota bacterium]|jgi:hypothetical protein|nr:hypothetical protein [Actinomycetota bacterium]